MVGAGDWGEFTPSERGGSAVLGHRAARAPVLVCGCPRALRLAGRRNAGISKFTLSPGILQRCREGP